VDPSSNCVA